MKIHTVGDVMTDEVVQAHRETPFKDVVRLVDAHRISGLPVVDHDDKVIGVVSGTDLARGQAAGPVGAGIAGTGCRACDVRGTERMPGRLPPPPAN